MKMTAYNAVPRPADCVFADGDKEGWVALGWGSPGYRDLQILGQIDAVTRGGRGWLWRGCVGCRERDVLR